MRIVYVSADRGIGVFGEKGASIHIQEIIRAFVSLGHDVRCIAARRGNGNAGGLEVEEVPQTSTGTSRGEKEQAAMAQADAIEARLIALYRDWPFDMIYERYSLWSAAGCRAARKLGVPVVTEVNAPLILEQAEFRALESEDAARRIEREVIAGSTALAAVSRQVAQYLTGSGASVSRVHVIGNAVSTANFHPGIPAADIPGITSESFVVGFTGSLKMWHGVDILMEAFRRFHADFPQARLLICGDGPKSGWIEGFVAGARLEEAVTLAGWVDQASLPGMIACMDIATAPYPPSETHYFSPLKLYEYLAMGRPVVASDIGQTAELLAGSPAAWLVPPGDPEMLAKAFADLATDRSRREVMAHAAAMEGARHDWKHNAARIVKLARVESLVA